LTKGELILTITTILSSLTLGLWTTALLTKRMKTKGLKVIVALTFFILTLVMTLGLVKTVYFLRDKILFVESTADSCDDKINIFVGQFWYEGQSYNLDIEDGQFEVSEKFLFDRFVSERKLKGEYCCTKDSCKVQFRFDGKDTTFYISPTKTKRLSVGSSINKEFVVGTDENENFWVIM
jgi:hypothetical protein